MSGKVGDSGSVDKSEISKEQIGTAKLKLEGRKAAVVARQKAEALKWAYAYLATAISNDRLVANPPPVDFTAQPATKSELEEMAKNAHIKEVTNFAQNMITYLASTMHYSP